MRQTLPEKTPGRRVQAIDLARGAALLAMAVYHFTWDLEFFGYVPAGLTTHGGWRLFARLIAASFLFLVGVSLVLANQPQIRWQKVWRRLAMIVAAAAAITLATFLAVPDGFIFFGILHQIALASLLGLAFLRLPPLLVAAVAAAVAAAPGYLRSAFFDAPQWWWLGLSSSDPHSNDYVPLFPWFAPVLAGIAAAGAARRFGLVERLAGWRAGGWSRPLDFAGRHSLAFYLVHQPVLIACVWVFSQAFPAPAAAPGARFTAACQAQCAASRDTTFCTRYCSCVLDRIEAEEGRGAIMGSEPDEAARGRLQGYAAACTAEAEDGAE